MWAGVFKAEIIVHLCSSVEHYVTIEYCVSSAISSALLCACCAVCVCAHCVLCCVWELFKSHEKVHALKHTSLAGLSGAWALCPHLAKDNIIHRCIANDKMEENSKMLMPLFGGRYDIYRPFFGNCLIVLTNIHMIDYSFLIHKFENYIFRTSKGLEKIEAMCCCGNVSIPGGYPRRD